MLTPARLLPKSPALTRTWRVDPAGISLARFSALRLTTSTDTISSSPWTAAFRLSVLLKPRVGMHAYLRVWLWQAQILHAAEKESGSIYTSNYLKYFRSKTARLSDFSLWCPDEALCRESGSAILPRSLARELAPLLADARQVVDVERPDLQSLDGAIQWTRMRSSILLGVAGSLRSHAPTLPGADLRAAATCWLVG